MRTTMRSRVGAIALLGIYGMCGAACSADKADVIVRDAWVRLPAASRTDTAAYMVIENRSSSARSIVSASSPEINKIELHEMKMTDHAAHGTSTAATEMPGGSMMAMMPVTSINVPANGQATLAPNGHHMMLFGLKSELSAGGKVSIALKLDDGSTVPVTASVRAPE